MRIISAIIVISAALFPGTLQAYIQPYYQSYYQTYYQGYYQSSYALTFSGNVTIAGNAAVSESVGKGSGTFVIDHPLDPLNKLLFHSFVESPDAKNLYDGVVTLDMQGEAEVGLPAYFEALNKDFRYQLRPLGAPMPDLHVKAEIKNNRFLIGGGEPRGRVSWQVTGVRQDAYILAHPIIPEVEKGPDQIAVKGEYLYAEGYVPNFPITTLLGGIGQMLGNLFGR